MRNRLGVSPDVSHAVVDRRVACVRAAGAAGGTTCTKTVATATIKPGLPPLCTPTTFVTKVVATATGTIRAAPER